MRACCVVYVSRSLFAQAIWIVLLCIAVRSPYDAELFHVPQLDDEDLPGFGFFNSRLVEHTILRDNGYAAARR